jgi:hypothetical protein
VRQVDAPSPEPGTQEPALAPLWAGLTGNLLENIGDQLAFSFEALLDGVDVAFHHLGADQNVAKRQEGLLQLAGSAVINTVAHYFGGVVALVFKELLGTSDVKAVYNTARSTVRHAMESAAQHPVDHSQAHALVAFRQIQRTKILLARGHAVAAYWAEIVPIIQAAPPAELQQVGDRLGAIVGDQAVIQTQNDQTVIGWINYLAQLHHGAGDGENVAATQPGLDAIEQRNFAAAHHGILEVGIDSYRRDDGTFDLSEHDLSIDGVEPYAKEILRRQGTVGRVAINKVIRVYPMFHTLEPPNPTRVLLLGADNQILEMNTDHQGTYPPPAQLIAWADRLPLGGLR